MMNRLVQYMFWAAPGMFLVILLDSTLAVFAVGANPAVVIYVLFGIVLRVPVYALAIGWAALVSHRSIFFLGLLAAIGFLAILYFSEWKNYAETSDASEWMLLKSAYFIMSCSLWACWFGRVLRRIKF